MRSGEIYEGPGLGFSAVCGMLHLILTDLGGRRHYYSHSKGEECKVERETRACW